MLIIICAFMEFDEEINKIKQYFTRHNKATKLYSEFVEILESQQIRFISIDLHQELSINLKLYPDTDILKELGVVRLYLLKLFETKYALENELFELLQNRVYDKFFKLYYKEVKVVYDKDSDHVVQVYQMDQMNSTIAAYLKEYDRGIELMKETL
jgi:hypothetical protein